MSLKASVGPWKSSSTWRPPESPRSGAISGRSNTAYELATSAASSGPGMSVANLERKRAHSSGYASGPSAASSPEKSGSSSGTKSPPSGARPEATASAKPTGGAPPRVET